MAREPGHPEFHRRRLTVERRFQGSVFDVADAKRFARVTASWWGVDAQPVEAIVDDLARRAVCREDPRFRVALALEGTDMSARVEPIATDGPAPE